MLHPDAEIELSKIPAREKAAVDTALDKPLCNRARVGLPHTSAVRGGDGSLRELRPRQGRCPWRAFYGQIGDTLVVAAIGPEAGVDPRGFTRAIKQAARRLDDIEQED